MPVDWVTIWGAQITGFIFRPVLEHLATKAAEGFVSDFMKGCLKSVLTSGEQDEVAVMVGKAMKEFLQIVQDELEGVGVNETQISDFASPIESLLLHRSVQNTLRNPLISEIPTDPAVLAVSWNELHLPDLPAEFSWLRVVNRYTKRAIQLRRESKTLGDILDSEVLQNISNTLRASAPVTPDADLRRYQKAMLQTYGHLKLEALDASTYDLQRIRLDRVFVAQHVREFTEFIQQVFEIPKEFQKRIKFLRQVEGQTLEDRELSRFRRAYFKQTPRSVLQLFQDGGNRRLTLLGDPGSGKSSLLQVMVLQWAEYVAHDLETLEAPLLIELKEYARNRRDGSVRDFLEFLHHGTGIPCRLDPHSIAERLRNGKACLLLDGLDEVFDPEQRKEICIDIARFANDYRPARIVVTSRVIGYKAQILRDAGFRHFMLQDLDAKQIENFVQRWHALAYPEGPEKREKQERLRNAIEDSRAIRELAGNPLLLTMMAILNRTQELPRDRAGLYEQCSRLLLYQWKAEEALRADDRFKGITLDFKDKHAMLRRVARVMQSMNEGLAGNLISQDQLEHTLEEVLRGLEIQQPKMLARAVIDHLRTRNFILCFVGDGYYAFVHRTFLEYFCASDFLWQFKEERIIDLEYLKTNLFGVHWSDERWAELLYLIAGMLVPKLAGELIAYLLKLASDDGKFQNVFLAARCYSEVRNKGEVEAVGVNLRRALRAVVSTPLPAKIKGSVKKLRTIGVASNLEVDKIFEEARRRNELAAKIRESRPHAIQSLITIWPGDPENEKWLKEIAESNEEAGMREVALRRLSDDFGELPVTFDFFTRLTDPAAKPIIRLATLSHLERRWPNDQRVVEMAHDFIINDRDPDVQKWGIKYLGNNQQSDPRTRDTLIAKLKQSLNDAQSAPNVRTSCYAVLRTIAPTEGELIETAKMEIAYDAHVERGSRARRAAVMVLAQASLSDGDVDRLLMNLAGVSPSSKCRDAAGGLQRLRQAQRTELAANSPVGL